MLKGYMNTWTIIYNNLHGHSLHGVWPPFSWHFKVVFGTPNTLTSSKRRVLQNLTPSKSTKFIVGLMGCFVSRYDAKIMGNLSSPIHIMVKWILYERSLPSPPSPSPIYFVTLPPLPYCYCFFVCLEFPIRLVVSSFMELVFVEVLPSIVGVAAPEPRIGTYREFADNIVPYIKESGYNTIQM